jgi:NADH-quinone oxidoreductase subunit L
MTTTLAGTLAIMVLAFPLAGCLLNGIRGPRWGRKFVNLVGPTVVLASFVVALVALFNLLGQPAEHRTFTAHLWTWLNLNPAVREPHNLISSIDVTIDPLSVLMMLVITGVGFLIHVYSVGYMSHEPDVARFFSYMNLFIFSMLVLVLAADMVLLIIGWALVALSSYLLIGFWYQRPSAVAAARKAFITQVIGDVALVLAAFMIVTHQTLADGSRLLNSLSLPAIFENAGSFGYSGSTITWICVLLAIGAFAKSAQFPLHTWLPDAMEGPTPVSALIHAATMVTAGVYLIARFHPLFDRAPIAQGLVACVGMGTALMAGIIALSQIDIKRVIAYSTMSQIGLMIFAVGIGAYTAGMYHFATHAVFKALLFMAAGNVIHALHDEQDIRLMGGLSGPLRRTAMCFGAGTLALAGFPLFAGWNSKEYLLGFGLNNGPGSVPWLLFALGLTVNILTGLYAARLFLVVFRWEPQSARSYAAHEAPASMLVPVGILGVLSVVVGWALLWPVPGLSFHPFADFLEPVFASPASGVIAHEAASGSLWLALALGTVASLIGLGLAVRLWAPKHPQAEAWASRLPRFITQLSLHRFYFDELYDWCFARPTAATARAMRRVVEPEVMDGWITEITTFLRGASVGTRLLQTGFIRTYVGWMFAAAALASVWVVLYNGVVIR